MGRDECGHAAVIHGNPVTDEDSMRAMVDLREDMQMILPILGYTILLAVFVWLWIMYREWRESSYREGRRARWAEEDERIMRRKR